MMCCPLAGEVKLRKKAKADGALACSRCFIAWSSPTIVDRSAMEDLGRSFINDKPLMLDSKSLALVVVGLVHCSGWISQIQN